MPDTIGWRPLLVGGLEPGPGFPFKSGPAHTLTLIETMMLTFGNQRSTVTTHDRCTCKQEGLTVASIARDVVVEMAPPATAMRGKLGSEFET